MFFLVAVLILKPDGICILKFYLGSWLGAEILLMVPARISVRCPYFNTFPYFDSLTPYGNLCKQAFIKLDSEVASLGG